MCVEKTASVRVTCRVNLLFITSSTQPSYLYVNFNVSDQGMEQEDFPESKVQVKGTINVYIITQVSIQHCVV